MRPLRDLGNGLYGILYDIIEHPDDLALICEDKQIIDRYLQLYVHILALSRKGHAQKPGYR